MGPSEACHLWGLGSPPSHSLRGHGDCPVVGRVVCLGADKEPRGGVRCMPEDWKVNKYWPVVAGLGLLGACFTPSVAPCGGRGHPLPRRGRQCRAYVRAGAPGQGLSRAPQGVLGVSVGGPGQRSSWSIYSPMPRARVGVTRRREFFRPVLTYFGDRKCKRHTMEVVQGIVRPGVWGRGQPYISRTECSHGMCVQ